MSKYGNEMINDLANLLNKHGVGLDKTAAKKDKEEPEEKKEEAKDEAKEEKEDKKEEKKEKPKGKGKKKKAFMADVLSNLVKLAEELDASGAREAANLVDDALKIIVKNIKEDK